MQRNRKRPAREAFAAMAAAMTARQIAAELGVCFQSVYNWAKEYGISPQRTTAPSTWTDEQIAVLREAYTSQYARDINLDDLAARIGRHKTNVCRKARELGLTDQARPKIPESEKVVREPMFKTDAERRAHQSEVMRRYIQENGHPRGALGMKHSKETLDKMSGALRRAWADPTSGFHTEEASQARRDRIYANIRAGKMRAGYTRSAGGKRPDLDNRYFRSSWEANYARYLNWLLARGEVAGWEFEPKTFEFEGIKRGTRFYTPDFLVKFNDGSHEWHEVKGWMDAASKTRLKRMAKYHPHEKVVVVGEKWFRAATKQGLPRLIPNWETNGRGSRGC